ncbi:MAG: adenylate kinase [Nanoarchaeota archaeon]|nr:adenylate kinase [Nanoarchaeota archaeon]MBU1270384.1 adenylate kinase [Nanoarchaeota archaeon]MBU1604815.1 adenylate kinase [Nanoarchaeota archaeon]MBU2442798.1 adenylate kinase [Nanoarchaeota archaeon]
MNLIIFGPQASGKGTQAEKIASNYQIIHISTGDIFRNNISKGTELGRIAKEIINKGNLVPDDITNKIVENRLAQKDCDKGFILDGYPRNYHQVEFLDKLHRKITRVINLDVPREELIKRISNRRVCSDCKANYNLIYIKPKKQGLCDECEGTLVQRDDDKPKAIEKRLNIYDNQTKQLLDFYQKKGVLININGDQPIEKVFKDIISSLNSSKH